MTLSRALIGACFDALLAACAGNQGVTQTDANRCFDVQGLEHPSRFGVLLRRHRLTAGLSQEALAERARMSPDGISALERGHRRNPQRQTLVLLADALQLSRDERAQFESVARCARLASACEPPSFSEEGAKEKRLLLEAAG